MHVTRGGDTYKRHSAVVRIFVVSMATALAAALFAEPGEAQTLREVLATAGVSSPPGAPDLDQPITSYAVLDDHDLFAIAYYWRQSVSAVLGTQCMSASSTNVRLHGNTRCFRDASLERPNPDGPWSSVPLSVSRGRAATCTWIRISLLRPVHFSAWTVN
jgi:hypothetical protein